MNYGDLVRVAGYESRIFQIDGYRMETYHYPDETWTDIVYELTDVESGEWLEADKDELILVAPSANAIEYLQEVAQGKPFMLNEKTEGASVMSKPIKKSKRREIDELLDSLNVYMALAADETGDKYSGEIAEIKRMLAEASSERR